MLKEHNKVLTYLIIICDYFLIIAAFFIAYLVRGQAIYKGKIDDLLWLLPIITLVLSWLLYKFGVYKSIRTKSIYEVVSNVYKATIVGFLIFAGITYVFKIPHISRIFILSIVIFSTILVSAEKILLVLFFRSIRKKGFNTRNMLVVGTGKRAQHFIDLVKERDEWGLIILGLIDKDKEKIGQEVSGCKIIGSFENIPEILKKHVVDEVVFITPRSWLDEIEEIMLYCENLGLKVSVAVDYFELKLSKAKQTELQGFPMLTFESTPDKVWHLLIKRIFDIVVSGVGIIVLFPFLLVISIIIKLSSKGPVFFNQKRCGINGRTFTLYKFRTMYKDAEQRLEELSIHNEMQGPVFKMKNDPRVTPIGKFLRKFSLDEFPQLWNVFKGDMSLIGPRPPLPKEVKEYQTWQRRRLSMRPGLTCLWQASGRNNINEFDRWVKLDLEYIDNWSLWLDLKIFFKTMPVVVFGVGAK
ncbi:MAG: sugar transferase [Candidatus Omnitrophica bacterium]|nr:sugar transferase [Candidatus Omnitrophota bacterium]